LVQRWSLEARIGLSVGTWRLRFGVWTLSFRVWSLRSGAWRLCFGTRLESVGLDLAQGWSLEAQVWLSVGV